MCTSLHVALCFLVSADVTGLTLPWRYQDSDLSQFKPGSLLSGDSAAVSSFSTCSQAAAAPEARKAACLWMFFNSGAELQTLSYLLTC